MPFKLINGDITKQCVDAIVNAANTALLRGGGVCGAIFAAAGESALEAECRTIGTCQVGRAVITKGYALPAKYIIHTVGPMWQGGNRGEAALLYACYRNSLLLAEQKGCQSIAFPLISSGIFGYPRAEAQQIAENAIKTFLETHEMSVYLVLFE